MTSLKKKFVQGIVWMGSGTFAIQIISWIATIFVIRLLSPADYGLMSMAAIVIALLLMVSDLGMGSAIIQTETISPYQTRQLLGVIVCINGAAFAFSFLTAPFIAVFFGEPRVVSLIRCLSLNFILMSFYIVPQSLCIRDMNFKTKTKVDFVARLASSLITLLLAFTGYGIWSLVFGEIALHLAKVVGFNITRPNLLVPVFKLAGIGESIRFGSLLTVNRVLYWAFTQLDKVIIGKFLGKDLLGIYGVAMNLAMIPMDKFMPILTQVSFSAFSRIQNDSERLQSSVLNLTHMIAFVMFPVFWGMLAVAPEAIPWILGHKWASSVIPFQFLCGIIPLLSLSSILSPALYAVGRPDIMIKNMAVAVIVMGVAFLLGVQKGLVGVCIAWVAAYPVVFIINSLRSLNVLGVSVKDYAGGVTFPITASGLMAVVIFALRPLLANVSTIPLLGAFVIGGMVFYGGLILCRKTELAKLRSILRTSHDT